MTITTVASLRSYDDNNKLATEYDWHVRRGKEIILPDHGSWKGDDTYRNFANLSREVGSTEYKYHCGTFFPESKVIDNSTVRTLTEEEAQSLIKFYDQDQDIVYTWIYNYESRL